MSLASKARKALKTMREKGFGSAGVYLGATLLARIGAFALIPLYTRKLSLAEYGEYALAQTLVQILPTFLSFGLLSAVSRFYYDDTDLRLAREKVGGAARWMALLTLSSAATLQCGLWAFWPPGGRGIAGRWELSCIVWAGAGVALAGVPAYYLRAVQRPFAAAGFQLGQFVSMIGAGLFLVAGLERGLRGAIEACALAYGIDGLVGLAYILVVLRGRMTKPILTEGLRFSLPFIPHIAANQLQQIADRWILKAVGLAADLGAYAIATQVAAPIFMATIAWNDAASPRFGELYRAGGLRAVRAQIGSIRRGYLLVAIVPAVALLLSLPIVAMVLGDRATTGLKLVPLVCSVMVIETIYFPMSNVVFFASRASWIPKITITSALLNLGLNVLFISWFGVVGAILARGASMGVRSAAMWWAAERCFRDAAADPAATKVA